MAVFELTIALLLVGAILTMFAERFGIPYPAMLALAGAAFTFIPGTPTVVLDPQLALALFVAPVLLDAAFDASPRDLKRNLFAVTSLAILAVGVTTVVVALVARHFVPGMSWGAAIVLGAIVAPPDTSAATTILRSLRPPHRLVVILQGESLFNDASALLIYRVAVMATTTGAVSGWTIAPLFLLTCGGGVVVGIILARTYFWLTVRVRDFAVNVILQFIGTFSVWLIADRLGLSSILTVIAYAMTLARMAPTRTDGRRRISSYAVWDVAVFVLNVLAFVMIGLQLRGIESRTPDDGWHMYLVCAAAVSVAVVLTRMLWLFFYATVVRGTLRHFNIAVSAANWRGFLIVGWCGMRGIVTLAAALALPDGSAATAFPHRDLIILCAFSVVLTTLVVQGTTLRPLLKWVGLKDDGQVENEIQLARAETSRAALKVLEDQPSRPVIEELRRAYEGRVRTSEARMRDKSWQRPDSDLPEIQRRLVAAQRNTLLSLRERWIIGDDAFHAAEEEIDLIELAGDERLRPED